jgi:catechol 2,3-dioxygenase-like lactoylglutathione lyase family enzyme
MQVRKLDHVAFFVRDVERSRTFYRTVFNLPEVPRPATFNFPGAWLQGPDFQIHLIGDEQSARVEREGYVNPYTPDELARGSATHAAFEVADLQETIAHLKAHDIEILGGPRPRGDGVLQIFINDPDGYVLEFFSRPA